MKRLLTRAEVSVGVVAAVVALAGTALAATAQDESRSLDVGAIALIVVAGLALSWRRTAPVVVLEVVVGVIAGYLMLGYPYGPIQLCMVFAMFEVGRLRGLRVSAIACAIAVLVTALAQLSRMLLHANQPLLLAAVWASWLVVPWSIGALVQVRYAAAQRSRRELVSRAALEERMRVAREVHDIAGHGFSAVAMQAGVALLVFEEQPEQAKESLQAIQSTSTTALAELREMLDAFQRRSEGLQDVAVLVDTVRAAGVPVQLVIDQHENALPGEIDRVAYRVVQEALTNVLRHAGPTTAQVSVRRQAGRVVVEVLDHGVGAADLRPGLGLAGMRKRVASVAGELIAENHPGGGFRVSASLPVGEDLT